MGTVQVWEVKDEVTLAMLMSTAPNAVVTVAGHWTPAPIHAGCASHGYAQDYFRSRERQARRENLPFSYLVYQNMDDFTRSRPHSGLVRDICTVCSKANFND